MRNPVGTSNEWKGCNCNKPVVPFQKGRQRLLKVHGAERSGTNMAAWLLNTNFPNILCIQNYGLAKHHSFDPQKMREGLRSENPQCVDRVMHKTLIHPSQVDVRRLMLFCTIREPYEWLAAVVWFYSKEKKELVDDAKKAGKWIKKYEEFYQQDYPVWIDHREVSKRPVEALIRLGELLEEEPQGVLPAFRLGAGFDYSMVRKWEQHTPVHRTLSPELKDMMDRSNCPKLYDRIRKKTLLES